jgi:hypothetical protein
METELRIEKAKAADCIAISQVLKILKDSPAYMAASKINQSAMEEQNGTR